MDPNKRFTEEFVNRWNQFLSRNPSVEQDSESGLAEKV